MLKISIVSYSNSLPFRWGLEQCADEYDFQISLDHPADCAKKLRQGQVDVGLVPVALLASMPELNVITNYGIAAKGEVATVKLYSNQPLDQVEQVKLDYQSMSSANLCKILFKEYWELSPEYVSTSAGFEMKLGAKQAMVVIGDRCFDLNGQFPYEYDLALEWEKFTGLPFVFAVWASRKHLTEKELRGLNQSLSLGVKNKETALQYLPSSKHKNTREYWSSFIVFELDPNSEKAYQLYLKKLHALQAIVSR